MRDHAERQAYQSYQQEMDKLKAQQSALIAMRDQLDRHAEMQEMGDLFDEMFGG